MSALNESGIRLAMIGCGGMAVQDGLDGKIDAYQRPIDEHWKLV